MSIWNQAVTASIQKSKRKVKRSSQCYTSRKLVKCHLCQIIKESGHQMDARDFAWGKWSILAAKRYQLNCLSPRERQVFRRCLLSSYLFSVLVDHYNISTLQFFHVQRKKLSKCSCKDSNVFDKGLSILLGECYCSNGNIVTIHTFNTLKAFFYLIQIRGE